MDRREFAVQLSRTVLAPLTLDSLPAVAESPALPAEAPFKLSVMLWTVFRDLAFDKRLEKVAEAGYHAVELVGEFEGWSEENYREMNALKRSLGLTFDATAGVHHGAADPAQREAFLGDVRKMLDVANKLECPSVIVLSGNVVPGMPRESQRQSCIDGLKRAADIVDPRGITLLLENIDLQENPSYYLWSVAEGFEVIEKVGHPRVKMLYDFYHEQVSEGDLIAKLEKQIDKVGLIHIADVPGRHEPGTGEVNYQNIYKTLLELKYDKYVAMEFIPSGDAVASLRDARRMVQHVFRAGRNS
jgi:hydroxypyruvate isomerase